MATKYVVLKQTEDQNWEEIGQQEGPNDLSAIKSFLGASDGKYGAGVYRGVPRRSWPEQPHDLKPQISYV